MSPEQTHREWSRKRELSQKTKLDVNIEKLLLKILYKFTLLILFIKKIQNNSNRTSIWDYKIKTRFNFSKKKNESNAFDKILHSKFSYE